MLDVSLKQIAPHEAALRFRQTFDGHDGDIEKRIGRRAGGVFFDLRDHRRHQVEGLAHMGKFFQDLHHSRVIFQRMQPGPRQLIFAGPQILVERLVHVP